MFVFIFNSCNKDNKELIVESTISSSFKGFQSLFNQPTEGKADYAQNSVQSSAKKDNFRRLIPNWIKAKLRHVGNKDFVVVPMFAPGYLFVGEDGSEKIPLAKATKLLAYKSDGDWIYEIVTKIIEPDGLTTRVNISDWHGNFKRGYRYLKDGSIKAIADKKSSNGKSFTTSSTCFVTTYYSCVSISIGGQFIGKNCDAGVSSTTCSIDFVGWVEPLPRENYLQLGGGGMTVEEETQAETDFNI